MSRTSPVSLQALEGLFGLIDQHIAVRADITSKAPTAQDKSLAKSATIGELRKVQIDALHAVQANRVRVSVIG